MDEKIIHSLGDEGYKIVTEPVLLHNIVRSFAADEVRPKYKWWMIGGLWGVAITTSAFILHSLVLIVLLAIIVPIVSYILEALSMKSNSDYLYYLKVLRNENGKIERHVFRLDKE